MNRCPKCHHGNLRISVVFTGTVDIHIPKSDPDEWEVTDSEPGDSEWDADSDVECLDCDWTGSMSEIDDSLVSEAEEGTDA